MVVSVVQKRLRFFLPFYRAFVVATPVKECTHAQKEEGTSFDNL